MPQIPGFPERPRYNSVEAYLSELAKDIAEMVADPRKMGRFREQLKIYADLWKQWTTADEANRKGCWTPAMGRPECIFNIFSRSYNLWNEREKEAKMLAGSYALCALIHDKQLPHLVKINTNILPVEAIAETLSAPKNTLEHSILGSGPNVREIYLIEEFFNRVKVDQQEFCGLKENKSKQKFVEKQIQQSSKLSDIKFFELTAEKLEERAKKILAKDETWYDLDRSLKGWFEAAIKRLERLCSKDEIGLLKYFYKNLLYYAEGINIKNFRGFPDSRIAELASQAASKLAEEFKKLARSDKENIVPKKPESESDAIVELLKKDYLLEHEDNLNQKIAEISQNFISRGLFNSTACVGQQLQACFDHNNKLIDHIMKTLQLDFADIPPDNVKENLLFIVEEEYKKLIPFANSLLFTAGLAQQSTLESFKRLISDKKEKTKQAIKTKFAILEKQKATPTSPPDSIFGETWNICGIPINVKKLRTKLKSHPIWLILCFLAIALIATYQLWWPLINKIGHNSSASTNIHSEAKTSGDSSPSIVTSGPNSPVTVNYDSASSKTTRSDENKLNLSLKKICEDIESRPLVQQEETAKHYVGIQVKEQELELFDIYPKNNKFGLSMIIPGQPDVTFLKGIRIYFSVDRNQYPELNAAKKGLQLYVTGKIEEATSLSIQLSDVSLKFE
jgi:hypothetical protein